MNKIRVLVVEDQSIVREGMVAILSHQADIEVVGEAKDGIEAMQMARKAKPDVILLDMGMPRQNGLIARGLSNQEIAGTLVVHERTIAKYVSSILNKLHLANRTQVALYAIREGLASAVN